MLHGRLKLWLQRVLWHPLPPVAHLRVRKPGVWSQGPLGVTLAAAQCWNLWHVMGESRGRTKMGGSHHQNCLRATLLSRVRWQTRYGHGVWWCKGAACKHDSIATMQRSITRWTSAAQD